VELDTGENSGLSGGHHHRHETSDHCAAMSAERLIDTPKLRAKFTERLAELLNGQVAWENLDVRLLPLPQGVVRDLHVEIPDALTVDVASADVQIRLLPLFHGNVEVRAITLERPNVAVWISASAANGKEN
jgi:uncharacterized protein involved in outer membrane biogenesis